MKGSGMPVMGTSPMVMAMFTNTCTVNSTVTPMAIKVPNRSLAEPAMRMPLNKTNANRPRTVMLPRNPFSSAMTEKMKSLCATERGR